MLLLTQLVSLPIKWTRQFNIKKGDELEVEEQGNKIIVSTEREIASSKVEIDFRGKDPELIRRALTSLYRSGYDEIGIISNNEINQTKLEEFYHNEYDFNRGQLGIKDNFYFTFNGLTIDGSPVEYVGKKAESKDLVQVTRFAIYAKKPVKFYVYVWR